jgi:hypothetical protein
LFCELGLIDIILAQKGTMLDIINGLVTLPVVVSLLLIFAAGSAIIIRRRMRYRRLIDAGADLEFISLLNDRHAFCDSEEEFKALLEREANEPPAPVEDNRSAYLGAFER